MADSNDILLGFTLKEAMIIYKALANHIPAKDDEMITYMLYARFKRKVEEVTGKNEPT